MENGSWLLIDYKISFPISIIPKYFHFLYYTDYVHPIIFICESKYQGTKVSKYVIISLRVIKFPPC